jgi:S-adenosylhomocysteine hydrolase
MVAGKIAFGCGYGDVGGFRPGLRAQAARSGFTVI